MRTTGRFAVVIVIWIIHSSYLLYEYLSHRGISVLDWLGYPFLLSLGYLAGWRFDRASFYAYQDPLTRLYNRRYADGRLPRMIRTARRRGRKLYVLLIDCDDFKLINDTSTHAAGDEVLAGIGRILLRQPDEALAARWGGDEFLVWGYCRDRHDVARQMDRLRLEISGLSAVAGRPVDISIGSALFPDDNPEELSLLLQLADDRMYAQKKKPGRCRLSLDDRHPSPDADGEQPVHAKQAAQRG